MLARGRPVRSVLTDLPSCELMDNGSRSDRYVKVVSEPILYDSIGAKDAAATVGAAVGRPC